MEKGWFLSRFAKGGVQATAYFIFKAYIIPYGIPIMTAVVAWAQDIQWAYLIALVVFVAAMVFHGLVQFDEWQARTRVEDKISFKGVRFGNEIHGDGMTIGFEVNNLANFPIDYKVSELMVRLGDRVPKKEHKLGKIYTLSPYGMGWYNSHGIKIENPPSSGVIEGEFSFTLQYGRLKDLKYTYSKKRGISIQVDNNGRFQNGASYDI